MPLNLPRALIARIAAAVGRLRVLWIRLTHAGCHIASGCRFCRDVVIAVTDGGTLLMGRHVHVGRGCALYAQAGALEIGDDAFIGDWCTIATKSRITIGRDCLIAERVTIRDQDHVASIGSTPRRRSGFNVAPIRIGNNVWIGAGAVILRGVVIGDNAVIGANAVVTSRVEADTVAVGAPARAIRCWSHAHA